MKRHLLPVLALLCATSAMAADYFVVVPVKGRTATAPVQAITVSLQAATLPAAMVGEAYSYNLRDHLLVTGDNSLDLGQATLSTVDALPAGLSLAANGVLAGTPTWKNEAGSSFQVTASYKTKTGQQAYTIVVNGAKLNVTQLSLGYLHSCAITTAGAVKCWGLNDKGQLGDGTTTTRLTPVNVVGLSAGVVGLSVGVYHSCALMTSGGVKCWGYDALGQLGNDAALANQLTPVDVAGLTSGMASVAAGAYFTCALSTSGSVKCWGANGVGQLGDKTTTNRATPVDAVNLTMGVKAIAPGGNNACVLTNAGGVKCWGYNYSGQLGNNSTADSSAPVDVFGLTSGVAKVYFDKSGAHACVIMNSGGAKCWGTNSSGELGDVSKINKSTPVDVFGLTTGVASLSLGARHTCALTVAGGVKCWGYDAYGQLGNDASISDSIRPVSVQGLDSGVVSISSGHYHNCATTASGTKCWGYNINGQLADGTTVNRPTPVDVSP